MGAGSDYLFEQLREVLGQSLERRPPGSDQNYRILCAVLLSSPLLLPKRNNVGRSTQPAPPEDLLGQGDDGDDVCQLHDPVPGRLRPRVGQKSVRHNEQHQPARSGQLKRPFQKQLLHRRRLQAGVSLCDQTPADMVPEQIWPTRGKSAISVSDPDRFCLRNAEPPSWEL